MRTSIDRPAAPAAASATFGNPVPAPLVRPRKDFPRVLARFDKAIATAVPAGLAIQVGPTALARDDLRAGLKPLLDLYRQLDALLKQTQKVRQQIEALTPSTYRYLKSIKLALVNALGLGHPQLATFGIPLPKRRPLTAAEKFKKTERAKRTRKIRNTLGPRQRQKLRFQGELQARAAAPVEGGTAPIEAPD